MLLKVEQYHNYFRTCLYAKDGFNIVRQNLFNNKEEAINELNYIKDHYNISKIENTL